jgi:hypothetical protein
VGFVVVPPPPPQEASSSAVPLIKIERRKTGNLSLL